MIRKIKKKVIKEFNCNNNKHAIEKVVISIISIKTIKMIDNKAMSKAVAAAIQIRIRAMKISHMVIQTELTMVSFTIQIFLMNMVQVCLERLSL